MVNIGGNFLLLLCFLVVLCKFFRITGSTQGRRNGGAKRRHCPPLPFEKGAMGAQVPFHTIIISNFMIYQYQLETNLLQLFVHT